MEISGKRKMPAGPSTCTPAHQTAMTKAEQCSLHILQGVKKLGKRKDRDVFDVYLRIRVYQATPARREGGDGRILGIDRCQYPTEICWCTHVDGGSRCSRGVDKYLAWSLRVSEHVASY